MTSSPAGRSVRVLVVDDHPVVLAGLRFTLKPEDGFEFCGEAQELDEALVLARKHTPHLILLDLNLAGSTGDVVRQIREACPHSAILVFSMSPEELFAAQALDSGANGYLMKSEGFGALHGAVKEVLAGREFLSAKMKARREREAGEAGPVERGKMRDFSTLTSREREILRLIGEGRTAAEIAAELAVSVKTVAAHRENIKAKLRIETSNQLARQAMAWVLGRQE